MRLSITNWENQKAFSTYKQGDMWNSLTQQTILGHSFAVFSSTQVISLCKVLQWDLRASRWGSIYLSSKTWGLTEKLPKCTFSTLASRQLSAKLAMLRAFQSNPLFLICNSFSTFPLLCHHVKSSYSTDQAHLACDSHDLNQWFSTRRDFIPLGHLARSGDNADYHNWQGGDCANAT